MKIHRGAVSAGGRDEGSAQIDCAGDRPQAISTPQPGTPLCPESADPAGDSNDEPVNETNSQLSDAARLQLVSEGYFVLGQVPYALKVVRARMRHVRRHKWVIRTRLEPGDQQEVEIVRLIFELYGCQNMPVNHILNNLRAQNIPARRNTARWSLGKIDRILTDPVYIGATRYKDFVRYGAFQPIIEPWIFHAAMSRRHFEKMSKSGSLVQQKILGPIEGVADE